MLATQHKSSSVGQLVVHHAQCLQALQDTRCNMARSNVHNLLPPRSSRTTICDPALLLLLLLELLRPILQLRHGIANQDCLGRLDNTGTITAGDTIGSAGANWMDRNEQGGHGTKHGH